MGYRSDVAIGMAFPNREAVTAFLAHVRLSDKILPEQLAYYEITVFSDELTLLHTYIEWVKWYDTYPDVRCHNDLLGKAKESGAGTAFIRVGEEYNDIQYEIDMAEVDLDLYDLFGVSRHLIFPEVGTSVSDFCNGNKE